MLPMTLCLVSFINGLTHFLAKLRQTSRVSWFFMRKTFILALHQGKSVQNRGQSVILSGENHRLPYTIIGGGYVIVITILSHSNSQDIFFSKLPKYMISSYSYKNYRSVSCIFYMLFKLATRKVVTCIWKNLGIFFLQNNPDHEV